MSYYDRNYKKLKLNDMEYLNSGECAKILYNKEMILKKVNLFLDQLWYFQYLEH